MRKDCRGDSVIMSWFRLGCQITLLTNFVHLADRDLKEAMVVDGAALTFNRPRTLTIVVRILVFSRIYQPRTERFVCDTTAIV